MQTSGISIFHASSLLAVLLSGIAIFISQQPAEPVDPVPAAVDSAQVELLQDTISSLRDEVITLQFRLDALEIASKEKATSPDGDVVEIAASGELESRLIDAIDRRMETKGLEYAEVARQQAEERATQDKMNKNRDGFASWVDGGRAKLPNLYSRIRNELELAPQTAIEVEEILENGFQSMAFLTDQLYADPPPEGAEARTIMGEVKEEAGSIIQDLDELLTPEEMISLGLAYSEEVDPRLGQAIINNGKEGDDDDEAQN